MDAPQSNAAPEPRKRRVRYAGKNPRRYDEKYKEHNPEKYASDVAKVVASGKTPAGMHRPIMVAEIVEVLRPQPGECAVDCTLGYGGHTRALLEALRPGGRLIGLDVDPVELPKTVARLREAGFTEQEFTAVQRNFAGLIQVLAEQSLEGVDCILADLGISSMQLDNPERGFTFKFDGPLDLRLNPTRGVSAADWLAAASIPMLASALNDFADEPHSTAVAEALIDAQFDTPIRRTRQLAQVIYRWFSKTYPGRPDDGESDKCIRRVFQALRIAVNDEFGVLDAFLRNLPYCLKSGGRAAVLTFHSGEDRRVKHAFRDGFRSGTYSSIADDVILAGPDERRSNTRSLPAKLRWAVRSSEP
ncbi:MAG TPA: 16S rRNA (cytosine(1402)-N(4))-methyltransferase RsmH [Candidatus Limnocylindria bacterium]|jgi:16S rRNA (cytosine1402-N4)-methyltransferase|nr:16S rRNA (cytosine(1402)-N(4))-methyltransferase RsmH [Candidatus Limnocylindria bacterium]